MMPKQIKYTSKFKKDMKPYKHDKKFKNDLAQFFSYVQYGLELPPKYNNHTLSGEYVGEYDAHIRPNLVIIYHTTDDEVICMRIGTHNKLGLTESIKKIYKLLIKESNNE